MKKFLVVLLSLGLIAAFTGMAFAADATIKMGGAYYIQGNYINNQMAAGDAENYSRAYIHQRARIQTDLGVVEGLSFRMRFDALEKQWGQTDWKNNYEDQIGSKRITVATGGGNPKIQESVEFEQTIIMFKTAAGLFQIGYQTADQWGLDFASSGTGRNRIFWSMPMGNFTMGAVYEKWFEADKTQVTTYPKGNRTDADTDTYALFGTFKYTGGDAGLMLKWYNDRSHRADTVAAAPGQGGYKANMYQVAPYARATFGPFYVETELEFFGGDVLKWEKAGAVPDKSMSSWGAYVMGKFTMGPAAFGVALSNSTGDNGKDPSKTNEMPAGSGTDYNPALLLMNDTLVGQGDSPLGSTSNPIGVTNKKLNVLIANVFGTFKATPQLDFGAAFTWAKVNEKKTALSDELGFEFDVTASYKIYDNLTYKVGAGYLWTGDYFKGASATKAIGNDYMLMNNLQIVF